MAVDSVFGVAADGSDLYMVGNVAGVRNLIKVSVNFTLVPTPSYTKTATAIPLTGDDQPVVFNGHAIHGGSLYVATGGQHRVYKIDLATGATTKYAGNGLAQTILLSSTPVADAVFNTTGGLIALGDFIYMSEIETHRLLRFNMTTNTVEPYAGLAAAASLASGTPENARFLRPAALYPDNQGRFLVADRTNGTVRRVNPDADPTKAEVLHYVVVDDAGANPNAQFLQFFQGVGKCGPNTFAIDTAGKLRKLAPKN